MSCVVIFMGRYTFLGEIGTNVPHGLGTVAPPGVAGPAGAAGPTPWLVPSPMHLLSRGHNLDEQDPPRKHQFDRMEEVRITRINGPHVRPINRHNHHSKEILGVPEQRRFITRHRVGPDTSRGPVAPPNRHTGRNRPKELSLNCLRSSDQGIQGEMQWNTRLTAPLDLTAPVMLGPRVQPTSLAYKRHVTLAGLNTQRWSISISLFCSLRVGLV
jgi:hypothetical protein